jgi:hypothetical protein
VVKKLTFCKLLYHKKCKRRGVGGQKETNLVNVGKCDLPKWEAWDGMGWDGLNQKLYSFSSVS